MFPEDLDTANAPLPAAYEAAKVALANCLSIDECKDWADKAQALASYARQADDDELRKRADRIQARAVRRCGELLKTFSSPGERTDKPKAGSGPRSQRQAAEQAGMSERQQKTAVRVANVPEDQFEHQVEAEDPPTVSALAAMGTQKRLPTPPPGFARASHVLGAMRRFAIQCQWNDPKLIAGALLDSQEAEARQLVATIDAWLDTFIVNVGD